MIYMKTRYPQTIDMIKITQINVSVQLMSTNNRTTRNLQWEGEKVIIESNVIQHNIAAQN